MEVSKKYYYVVSLEISLKKENKIIGFINVSHIPYSKLEEIFKDEITDDQRFLFDDSISYIIDENLYAKHKDFLDKEIDFKFRFDLFQYAIGLGSVEADSYRKDYHEELPPFFKR